MSENLPGCAVDSTITWLLRRAARSPDEVVPAAAHAHGGVRVHQQAVLGVHLAHGLHACARRSPIVPSIRDAMPFQLPWKISFSRSKLLGLPTSMALESVCADGRGMNLPLARYTGTTSFTLVAAMNPARAGPSATRRRPR